MTKTRQSAPVHDDDRTREVHSFESSVRGCPAQARKPDFGGSEPRVVPEMVDIVYPHVPFPTQRVFEAAGEALIRELVHHHHALLIQSRVGHLFSDDEAHFLESVERTADFFVEMFGGPKHFTPVHGQPHLRERHFPVAITEADRITWLELLAQAMVEVGFPAEVREEVWNWVEPLSIRMINRRTRMEGVERLSFDDVAIFREEAPA